MVDRVAIPKQKNQTREIPSFSVMKFESNLHKVHNNCGKYDCKSYKWSASFSANNDLMNADEQRQQYTVNAVGYIHYGLTVGVLF